MIAAIIESFSGFGMIEGLLGSISKERVLIYILARGEGYPREIASFFDVPVTPIKNQMKQLEDSGILICRLVGRTQVYSIDPRCVYKAELEALINRVLEFYPENLRVALLENRRRPRKTDKPLKNPNF